MRSRPQAKAAARPPRLLRTAGPRWSGSDLKAPLGGWSRAAAGIQEFDLLCAAPGIEHSLAPPQHPQTNGMAECFNGRIKDVLQSHHFRSGEELETTLHRSVVLYNGSLQPAAAATGPGQRDRLRR
jgi:transposase InsO family protein